MTPAMVRNRVSEIAADAADAESAHIKEDKLYADVLQEIANENARQLAREALKTQRIKFSRWCA